MSILTKLDEREVRLEKDNEHAQREISLWQTAGSQLVNFVELALRDDLKDRARFRRKQRRLNYQTPNSKLKVEYQLTDLEIVLDDTITVKIKPDEWQQGRLYVQLSCARGGVRFLERTPAQSPSLSEWSVAENVNNDFGVRVSVTQYGERKSAPLTVEGLRRVIEEIIPGT